MSTGLPTMVNLVGSVEEIIIIVRVLEPALTATIMLPSTLRADWLKRESGEAVSFVLPSIPDAPLPPVRVIDPSERVPSAATCIATTEFSVASFVRKYIALAFARAVVLLVVDDLAVQDEFVERGITG